MSAPCVYNKAMPMDHLYAVQTDKKLKPERTASIFGCDHLYYKRQVCIKSTPTKSTPIKSSPTKYKKRKRDATTPTGKTPTQPGKIRMFDHDIDKKQQLLWTSDEKEYLKTIVLNTPKSTETLTQYWQTCADKLNRHFPEHNRNGRACKSLSQRLYITPPITGAIGTPSETATEPASCLLPSTVDAGTQTTLTLPVNSDWAEDHKIGDWVFMEPKKELKEGASSSAEVLNKTALKRLRHYPDMTEKEKARLINVICSGTSRQIARTILSSSLALEISTLMIYDIEMDARECSMKGSVLCSKQYQNLKDFKWLDIVNELTIKQHFLAEILLAVAMPSGKIGNTKATEALVPALGTVYGMLMKQRFHELSAVQKMVSIVLANEQTHQKIFQVSQL